MNMLRDNVAERAIKCPWPAVLDRLNKRIMSRFDQRLLLGTNIPNDEGLVEVGVVPAARATKKPRVRTQCPPTRSDCKDAGNATGIERRTRRGWRRRQH